MMLQLQVIPEKCLANERFQLVLGMALNQVIHTLQKQFELIHGIELLYSDKHPLTGDIILDLKKDGIRLVFEPTTQRLKLIEVNDLSKVKLTYSGSVFCSKDVFPTREQIDETFGATHPGEYDSDAQMFHLKFRGLCFSFDTEHKGPLPNGLSPIETNNLFSSVVSKMAIYSGTSHKDTVPPPLPLSSYGDGIFVEQLKVLREKDKTIGVEVDLTLRASLDRTNMPTKKSIKRCIRFGDCVSDVISAIGSPSKVFYKEEDKMRIHSPNFEENDAARERSDYFYNYFPLGMDILFDAKKHCAKKVVLHTNFPGHYNFNSYHRVNFTMVLPSLAQGEPSAVVNTFSKWDDIGDRLVAKEEKPVVLNRASCTNTTNPFGSTYCYGCCGDIIIEVMNNKHIASVTLFDSRMTS